MYDFIIIGGGPAGSTLARLIDSRFKVLIIEKSGIDSDEKVCGGLIAPDAQRMLGKFGLSLPNEILINPQMFYVESYDLATSTSQKYQRHYLNVNRKKFDNWLLGLVDDNVEILRETSYVKHTPSENGFSISVKNKTGIREFETRYLVGADGAHSVVRRKACNDFKNINKYVAIQSEIANRDSPKCYEVYFDRKITDFYGWTIPKDKNLIIGIALRGKDSKKRYEEFLNKVLGDDFVELNRKSCLLLRPRKPRDFKTNVNSNLFFIGEAAGFISPSSAEGFSYAFKSAKNLADSINCPRKTALQYRKKSSKIKFELYLKKLKSRVMYSQFLRNLIFKLGINKL